MNTRVVNSITQQIHHQFPEVAGQKPSVRTQVGAKGNGSSATYLLTFRGHSSGPGRQLARTVRVVADERGTILKVTTSR